MAPMSDWQGDPLSLRHHVLVLPLSGQVMFPGVRGTVELSQRTFERVRRSLGEGRTGGLGLAATRPGTLELYEIGTFCRIVTHSFLGQPRPGTEQGEAGARVRVVLEGRTRFRVLYYTQVSPLHITTVQLLEELPAPEGITVSNLALRVQRELLELLGQPKAENQPPWPASTSLLADVAGAALRPLPLEERQRILETMDVQCRLELVLPLLQREVETKRAQESKGDGMCWPTLARTGEVPGIGRGEAVDNTEEVDEVSQLKAQISAAGLPGDALRLATRELQRLQAMQPSHPEYAVASKYLETLASLPWQVSTEDRHELASTRALLDAEHHGLERVKRRLLEFIAVRKLHGGTTGPILCLHGPPGIGKTSIGCSIARALGRKFHRIALGGMRDEAELRGHRRTYIGSGPGVIIQALQTVGSNNPVILLDEIDKLACSANFNPEAALLEILDPEQNATFKDHFLGMPFDLSRTIFVCTANDSSRIGGPLLDRMEVLDLPSYTSEEKASIAATHLLPKQRRLHGLQREATARPGVPETPAALLEALVPLVAEVRAEEPAVIGGQAGWPWGDRPVALEEEEGLLTLTPGAIRSLIEGWTSESGVRSLERLLAQICRWAALRLHSLDLPQRAAALPDHQREMALASCGPDRGGRITVEAKHLPYIVGLQRSEPGVAERLTVGVAMGLGVTTSGGELLFVEAARMPGCDGQLTVTGSLGRVMAESVEVAMSLLQSQACLHGGAGGRALAHEAVHVHFPSGAAPKDGPSAGLTVLLALASLLRGRPLRSDAAALGEVTLRGQLLPVPGVRDRVLAAHRAGLRHVLLPAANRRQVLEDVPERVLAEIRLHYVCLVQEALDFMFAGYNPEKEPEASGALDRESCEAPSLGVPLVAASGGWAHGSASGPASKL